jgi:hypothetical protein
MPYGSVKIDSIVTSTKTVTVDNMLDGNSTINNTGDIRVLASDNATTRSVLIGPSDYSTSGRYLSIQWSHPLLAGVYYTQGAYPHIFYTSNTERMRLDSSGRLGIGVSTPATTLDVNGDVTVAGKIIHSGDTNTCVNFPANDVVSIETAGAERIRVDTVGNVGIGTTSPASKLVVFNNSAVSETKLSVGNATSVFDFGVSTNGAAGYIGSNNNAPFFFRVNGAERVRIDTSGRLLVGTGTGSARLTVSGNSVGVPSALGAVAAGTTTLDFGTSNNFSLSLPAGGTVTLADPSNLTAGQSGAVVITQNASTAAQVAYGTAWKFQGGAPSVSTTLSSVNVIAYYVESASRITAQLLTNTIS